MPSSFSTSVTYVYILSSDTLEDSVRLTIPCGLITQRMDGYKTVPDTWLEETNAVVPPGTNALTISVAIEVEEPSQIMNLNSVAHIASITTGFKDTSFKGMSPVKQMAAWKKNQAYVEFSSREFQRNHFTLVYSAPRVDVARCWVETLHPAIPGAPVTVAVALTMVSNLDLPPAADNGNAHHTLPFSFLLRDDRSDGIQTTSSSWTPATP